MLYSFCVVVVGLDALAVLLGCVSQLSSVSYCDVYQYIRLEVSVELLLLLFVQKIEFQVCIFDMYILSTIITAVIVLMMASTCVVGR